MSDVRFEPLVKGLLWRALYAVGRSVVLHAFYPSITVITSPIDTRSIHDRPHTHAHMTHMNHRNAATRSPHPPAYIQFLFSHLDKAFGRHLHVGKGGVQLAGRLRAEEMLVHLLVCRRLPIDSIHVHITPCRFHRANHISIRKQRLASDIVRRV